MRLLIEGKIYLTGFKKKNRILKFLRNNKLFKK